MTAPNQKRIILAALTIMLAEILITSAGAGIKMLDTLPTEVIIFIRNLFGMLLLLPLIKRQGPAFLKTRKLHLHLLRAVIGFSAMYCLFYTYSALPLAQSIVLKMTAPFFFPILAYFWLKEKMLPLALLAIPVGFLGIWLAVKPEQEFHIAILIGALGGLLAATAKTTIHVLGRTEPPLRVVFLFALFATVISLLPAILAWRTPQGMEWLVLLQIGICTTCAQFCMTKGYAMAPVTRVGPFSYSGVLFGAIFGYLFWGETVDWLFALGAVLIACAGVMAILAKPTKASVADNPEVE